MTINESLRTWIEQYPAIEIVVMTDQLESMIGSYGLYKTPTQNIIPFVDGSNLITQTYQFLCRQSAMLNDERIDNNEWFQAFEYWAREQDIAGNLPVLDTGLEAQGIEIGTTYYMQEQVEDKAIYQLSISITYVERG